MPLRYGILEDMLLKVSQLVDQNPAVSEIDLNLIFAH